jgi:threonine-phosphate decarboxylase
MIYVKRETLAKCGVGNTKIMKSIDSLIRDNVKNLKPCVHGAEVIGAAKESGLKPQEILDFSSSVNPLGPSKQALVKGKKAFTQISAYPDSNSNNLRDAIARHYGINRDNLVIGNGSTELMYLFTEVFLKNGETALIPAPTFGEYEAAVSKAGGTPKFVKLGKDFSLESEAFKLSMAGVKLVFFCNPNNPTSQLIPQETLKDLIETALEENILVFLDEDFLEFVDEEKKLTMINNIQKYSNLFVLRSFTKIFGLTGLRIGYGIANKEIIDVLLCAKIPWNVNCIAQTAALAALNDEAHLSITRDLIRKERIWLANKLETLKMLTFYPPDANFFFIDIRKSTLSASELRTRLLRQGILIRDCTSFRGIDEFWIRVAVKTHDENERLFTALKQTLRKV